jgi:hypothetical protein
MKKLLAAIIIPLFLTACTTENITEEKDIKYCNKNSDCQEISHVKYGNKCTFACYNKNALNEEYECERNNYGNFILEFEPPLAGYCSCSENYCYKINISD